MWYWPKSLAQTAFGSNYWVLPLVYVCNIGLIALECTDFHLLTRRTYLHMFTSDGAVLVQGLIKLHTSLASLAFFIASMMHLWQPAATFP